MQTFINFHMLVIRFVGLNYLYLDVDINVQVMSKFDTSELHVKNWGQLTGCNTEIKWVFRNVIRSGVQ